MITKENYEIYYLDHLEGNLSEQLSIELNLFLEAHPELIIDESVLSITEESIHFENKEDLKLWDEKESIQLKNIDGFIIANQEQLLTPKKQEELANFIARNSFLQKEINYYKKCYLQANLEVYFDKKAKLKQKENRVLWPWISSAAASLILLISITSNLTTTVVKYSQRKQLDLTISEREDQQEKEWNSEVVSRKQVQFVQHEKAHSKANKRQNRRTQAAIKIEKLPIRIAQEKLILPSSLIETEKKIVAETEVITASLDQLKEMNNPIWAVTNLVGAITNKEVDFRTGKATEKKSGGFRLKFGEFEIYKNMSKKM
ncbi:MAG: hypothetical protein ACPGU5_01310 [Lishizhenia sp.]